MQKRLRDVSVPVNAVADAAVDDRLAALEQQVIREHACKLELVQAVQNLQAVAAAGQQTLEVHDGEAEVNRAEHLELRRELFAVRDQLSEKLNFVAQQTESQLKTGFIDVIEAKFGELETAMKVMAVHLEQHVAPVEPTEVGGAAGMARCCSTRRCACSPWDRIRGPYWDLCGGLRGLQLQLRLQLPMQWWTASAAVVDGRS